MTNYWQNRFIVSSVHTNDSFFFSEYGPSIIDHVLLENGLAGNMRITNDPGGKGFYIDRDLAALDTGIKSAEQLLQSAKTNVLKVHIYT